MPEHDFLQQPCKDFKSGTLSQNTQITQLPSRDAGTKAPFVLTFGAGKASTSYPFRIRYNGYTD
jgi:hypothetical protein